MSQDISQVHDMKVGETADINVDGHPARTDSPAFVLARATMQKILSSLQTPPFEGAGPWQAHHGGSLWVHDGIRWRLFLNDCGIEWSSQFCADPAKIDALRENALAIMTAFPHSASEYEKLGYKDFVRLQNPIKTADDVAWFTDSIFNSCVPLNAGFHIGFAKSGVIGEHNDPKPITDIQHFKVESFQLLHVDPATDSHVAVAPVAPPGSGDGRVQVIHTSSTHPLHKQRLDAHAAGKPLILGAENPLAKAAFAKQQ